MNTHQNDFYNLLSAEIVALVQQFKKNITEQEWDQFMDMIETNELGVAFEGFCSFVSDHKLVLNNEQKEQIKILANTMKIEDRFWSALV